MKRTWFVLLPCLVGALAATATAQTQPRQLARMLEQQLQSPEVTSAELRAYLSRKIPGLPRVSDGAHWTTTAQQLRRRLLDEIVFHGWPREWVEAPLKVEDLGLMPSGKGYRMRKLRYEIVPGFYSTGILYEPESMTGRIPAILNVNGHTQPGMALEFKQKRCINQALQGILSLNLEWMGFGEMTHPENVHWFGGHLDVVGANAAGLFYLAMRKGLDYLYEHPNVDRGRLGVTGLSGGGWQTIVLSALDERVAVAVPVAGYSSVVSRIERPGDIGDVEQNPTDMLTVADYPHLTAMRAPQPTLLIYNAEDDCCFRGPLVKPYIFDHVEPFFRLYRRSDHLAWHLNTDPSDHNYQLDNRLQSYHFFTKHFGLPAAVEEIPVDAQIKSPEELAVGLPENNLTILGVAKVLAAAIRREPAGDAVAERAKLRRVVRYQPVELDRAWAVRNTHNKGLETRSYSLSFSNGLSATGVWIKALAAEGEVAGAIALHDDGRKAAATIVSERVNRGEQVLALDLLFTGNSQPANPGVRGYAQLLATTGDRALGIEAAQLVAAAHWLRREFGARTLRLEASGIRSQAAAYVAAAIEPSLFAEVVVHNGMSSFAHLLEKPVRYEDAPTLFCLDLFKEFDLDRIRRLFQ